MKSLLFSVIMLGTIAASAQRGECYTGRYLVPYYQQVDVQTDILFGENLQPTIFNPAARQQLFLDFYQPANDTLSTGRPLILWAFGGAFVFGSRKNGDIIELCNRFSQLGYANAAIDYRLTSDLVFSGSDSLSYVAVMKGKHDMQAAIRFFVQDARGANLYNIDTARIFVGGVSAGAITALHAAYLNENSEIPSIVDTTAIGGLAGLSGNPGFPMPIAGVINLCGGLGDTTWMKAGDIPVVSVHGDKDDVVPYGTDTITLFNLGLLLHGSASVQEHADRIGVNAALYTFVDQLHVPWSNNAQGPFMDTTFGFVRDFLYPIVCAIPLGDEKPSLAEQVTIWPNPAHTHATATWPASTEAQLQLIDIQGRIVWTSTAMGTNQIILSRGNLASGLYWLSIITPEKRYSLPMHWQ
jgi:hypothetical protein